MVISFKIQLYDPIGSEKLKAIQTIRHIGKTMFPLTMNQKVI